MRTRLAALLSLALLACSSTPGAPAIPPGCELTVAPSPIVAADGGTQVTLEDLQQTSYLLTCVALQSLGTEQCEAASAAFAFSGLPAFPRLLVPNDSISFTVAANAARSSDTLLVQYTCGDGGTLLSQTPLSSP